MAIFLLTNNYKKAEIVKNKYIKIYNSAEIFQISDNYIIVISNVFKKKGFIHNKNGNNEVFGFGTVFSDNGFYEDLLTDDLNICEFDQKTSKKLYGHYLFIIKNSLNIRILTDPVGLINIFWSKENDDVFVSNDLKAIADVNENKNLSEYGVQEFILNENTIGSNTMYCGINRLRFGNELILQEDKVSEQKLYDYNPEKIAFDEYLKRIEIYFSNISKFKGNIGVELSAGYDTRLVATCASRHIKSIKGITNENLADFGVDIATAEIIAKELKIPFTKIIRSKDIPLNEELMMHSLAMGRDVIRSKDMLEINKMKYEHSDLILSGYGGEILRGKHCKYKSTDDFADKYYYGNILLNWGFTETNKHIKKVLTEEYHQDWIDSSEKMSNWLYAMDRMRIWGGSSVVGKLICGDNLHPFMDWYLMEPLFSWNFDELKNNALALKIMKRFSQDITNIPFNSVHPIFIKEPLLSQKFISKKLEYLHRLLKRIFIKTGLKKENISEKIKEIFNRYPQINISDKLNSISKLSLKKLEQTQKINYFTRFATVQLTLDMID